MTQAKKTAKANRRTRRAVTGGKRPEAGTGPIYVEGEMHLCERDLLKYELAMAKVGNSAQAVGLKRAEIEKLQFVHAENVRKAREEMAMIVQADRQNRDALKALQTELEQAYGLDFTKIAYDDVTGRIQNIEDGTPVLEPGFVPPDAN